MISPSIFFLKDARCVARGKLTAYTRFTLAYCVALLLPWLALEAARTQPYWRSGVGWVLARTLAWVLLTECAGGAIFFASGRLGVLLAAAERRQGMLESLQLASLSPAHLTLQKLLFPSLALLTLWMMGWPFYAALALRGLFLPERAGIAASLTGEWALLGLGMGLLIPLAQQREMKGLAPSPALSRPLSAYAVPVLFAALTLDPLLRWLPIQMLISGRNPRITPLYGHSVSSASIQLAATLIFAGAALAAGPYTFAPAVRWTQPLLLRTSRVSALLLYGLLLGIVWSMLPAWARWAAALAPGPLLLIGWSMPAIPTSSRVRVEDPSSGREIAWIQARWDNPVLIRDLRSNLRGAGIGRCGAVAVPFQLLFTLAITAYTLLPSRKGMFASVLGPPGTWPQDFPHHLCLTLLMLSPLFVAVMPLCAGMFVQQHWARERRCEMHAQLFSTRLSAMEWLVGRLAASAISVVAPLGVSLVFALGAVELALHFWPGNWLYPASIVFVAGMGLAFGMIAAVGPLFRLERWFAWASLALALVETPLCAALMIMGIYPAPDPASSRWLVATLTGLTLVNLLAACGMVPAAVRQLRKLQEASELAARWRKSS